MNHGWICARCSASNAPSVFRCSCLPVQMQPLAPLWPTYPWWHPQPYTPWEVQPTYTRPYITWTSAGTGPQTADTRIAFSDRNYEVNS